MVLKDIFNKYKNLIIMIALISIIVLTWTFLSTYSDPTATSAWDGVVARNFTSGTGTTDNPYVINSAAEFAYFKSLLEGEEASIYANKNYLITSGFNYGEYDLSINNIVPFSGKINGRGNIIYNATMSGSLFNNLSNAEINNLNLSGITYSLSDEIGALFANYINNSSINMIVINANTSAEDQSTFATLAYTSNGSTYNNIVLNNNISSDSENIYTFIYSSSSDQASNILIKSDNHQAINGQSNITINTFTIVNNNIVLSNGDNIDNYHNNEYKLTSSANTFTISDYTPTSSGSGTAGNSIITEHASGSDGTTFYINDLTSDLNYLKGLNYAEVRSTSIPSGVSTGYYNDEYLVKVELIYDGKDLNNSNLVGALSPINNETTNKFVYFKYYPLERNTSGTLLTNPNGDNYIRIELLDNPFSKRPYTTQNNITTEYGFHNWVCNQDEDTTADVCANSKFIFDEDDYTRYLEIPVAGGSEIIVHLNASWYEADVITSASSITNFNQMSMQPAFDTEYTQETVSASYYWRQNYTQMEYERTVTRNGTLPRYYWYKNSQTGTTYTYVSRNNTRCNYTNCYIYSANQSAIVGGTKYNGGSVSFIPNFRSSNNNTETTIYTYNTTYMQLQPDPDGAYTMTTQVPHYVSHLTGTNAQGFFYKVSSPTNTMINTGKYYNKDGEICTSTNGCSTAYKLIHYNDETQNSNGNTISTLETSNNYTVDGDKYYYLVTRDMNIFRYTSATELSFEDLEENRPFTITGTSRTGTSATGVLEYPYTSNWLTGNRTYTNFTVNNDLVIENIKINGLDDDAEDNLSLGGNSKTSQVIYAASNNLKIGRNVTSNEGNGYLIGQAVFGGTNSSSPSGKSRVIIESGLFYAYHSGRMSSSSTNYTFNETTIFGNDYDRIKNDNSKLKFLIGLDGYAGGNNTAGSASLFASNNIIKSGSFGYNSDGTPNEDNTAGLYIGARSSTYMNSLTGAKIEGGLINTVVGGYGYNGSSTTNSTFIGMSGGSVRSIYGGAGHSTTKGNRIICVTGGTVSYSILGGSDSYDSGDTDDGVVQGDTLVYVGGDVTIGGGTGTLYGVESGSVFGAGGGDSTSTQKGTVYNSHVIINGGTINTGVYGGGNHGSTGTVYDSTSTAKIEVLSGNVANIYGGSKSAGFSQSDYITTSMIDIDITGGTIGNIYGGSNNEGDIYGKMDINITGGTITGNVYGGGRGGVETNPASNGTTTKSDILVTIGNNTDGPTIRGNVYGGSAFGSVNDTNSGNVTVTVNKGIINGAVFGGGEGDTTHTPTVNGNITVNINGGDITSVFGGNDQAGTYSKTDHIYLNGGTVGSVFGGGNRSSVTTTNVHLQGSTVTNIYGGSNALGDVTTANVIVSSGSVGNVYGGNNIGGTCATTNVTVQGSASVLHAIYGGGNEVSTTTTNVSLISATGTIPNVFGGGNQASVTTANITENGATVTNIYGGSNSSGTVTNSIITHTSGTTTNVFGGNNAGGNTLTSTINYTSGTTTTLYGGGNSASGSVSNINISGGTITELFGGGNNEGLSTSNITMTSGTATTIYGGSNNAGTVTTANITIDNNTNATSNLYGGGNRAPVGTTNVVINNGSFGNVHGGGNLAQVTNDTNVDINGGSLSGNLYGGGNYGVVKGSSYVYITDTTILGSAYAGGNGETAILEGNTNITIDGNTIIGTNASVAPASGCVFGGGNRAETGISTNNNSTSNVNIVGGTFYGNVYGGANTSVIYGSTVVNIGASAYTDQTLQKHNIYVKGHVFGGGEANASGSEIYDWSFISVTEGTHINVDANGFSDVTIGGSFFGGGNASSASGDSYLSINNYGTPGSPKQNVSIQRAKYVTINNSSILLKGAIDRANDYDKELFSVSRVDVLKIKNNSEIFFATGANLLKKFESLDANDNPASVTINENTNQVVRTVNNRIYMYEGKNLNIAKDQQVTDYGEVVGMTFLGIFNFDNNHNVNTGIYNRTYSPGDILDWSGTFSRGSYVLGLHETNHNIKVNGFYSNFINEETEVNEVRYIEPTPDDARFYMWFIGENVIEYNVNLVASKYSTLGSQEASFLEFSKPNTSFQILSFDSSEIAEGVSLVDKNSIPRIASNPNDANNVFGLSMEASNSGWLTTGKTSFYTREPGISGVTYYEGENTNTVPTMLFYLYHSKNLTVEKDLGTVRISVMAITKINAISNEVERLVINVNMSTALFQTTEYEGAMTPGDKYELFASTATNITTKSKFSAYYGLYAANSNAYQTGYHRVLSSSFVLPVGTKITMLDFNQGSSEYYYHVITQADYAAAQSEFSVEGECSYNLSMFTRMGSKSNNSNYNDAAKNLEYYDGTNSSEEFIFIVDFADTNITQNELGHTLLLEIRDANEESIITVLGIQHSQMTYNLYYGLDAQIDPTITPSANPLYIGYTDTFNTTINYRTSALNGTDIIDTQFFDNKLGAQIYIKNSDNNIVSGTDLTGTYFTVDGIRYYPDISGYTHIKLSDKVGNIQKWIIFNTENSSLPTGSYTFVIETFASPDGIYYSKGTPVIRNIPINIISTTYGLKPTISDDSTILRSINDKDLEFTIDYTSRLNNPSIRVAMYRRKYNQVYDTNYDLVDFQDFIDLELVETNHYEYLLIDRPNATNNFDLPMNENLITGTYRLVFRLYDNNTKIGEIIRYIIVK